MPKFLEEKLRKSGKERGFTGKHLAHYIFGAMNNLGAMRGSKETAKGRAMEKKHQRKMKHHREKAVSLRKMME